jgi:protein-tyrosine phosphatase
MVTWIITASDLGASTWPTDARPLESRDMRNILMVCTANICRSPMAKVVAQQLADQAGQPRLLTFDAAGTHAQNGGGRPDPRAKAVLTARKYALANTRSRRITAQDFEHFDLLLAMDESNLAALQRQCPAEQQHKLRLLLSFAPELGVTEVPDPYFGNRAGFERVLDLCEAGVRGLLQTRL